MRYPPIDNALFIENRSRFKRYLKPRSIAVFNANDVMPKSADGVRRFIQQTDIFYMCGIDQEETILLIFPDAPEEKYREILFVRETSEKIAVWEGPKLSRSQARDLSGVETVYWTHQFNAVFRNLVVEADYIYLNSNEHLRADTAVETRDARFVKWCRENYPLHGYGRIAPIMNQMRPVKSEIEVEWIKKACGITADAFARLLRFIRPGVWEYEIEAEIWHEFIRNGSRGPGYEPIVASGANSCILHYVQNHAQCGDGDLILIDFGAEYGNYNADMTRTVPAGGRFTERQKDVYNAVLRVQRAAIDMLRPGTLLEDYNKAVGEVVETELIGLGLLDPKEVAEQDPEKPLYKKYFMHGTSHHLGLDVHDYGSKYRQFESGMVLTCEPGIYIKEERIGIRLENDILITEEAPVDLMSDVPIEAEEIEFLMNER